MTRKELDRIIRRHQHWLKRDCKGWRNMQADLSGVDLSGVDLHGVNLSWARMSGTNLSRANLFKANLSYTKLDVADLHDANMAGAKLSWADLSGAKVSYSDMRGADLTRAILSDGDLSGAYLTRAILFNASLVRTNLSGADLSEANLSGANFELAVIYTAIFDKKENRRKGIVLATPIKGYKKTAEGVVITAEIPAGAVVFSINGKKCRTNIATITSMARHKLLHSDYNPAFTYEKGQKILITDFDTRYNIECGPGFHFFRTRKEAKDY